MEQKNAGPFTQEQKPFLPTNNLMVKHHVYKQAMNNKIPSIFCAATCAIFSLHFDNACATTLNEKGLCRTDEQVVFSCVAEGKIASVCASTNVTKESGYMQYRFGSREHTDMLYPKSQEQPGRNFFISSISYSGGGEAHLRFSVSQYDYIIYDRTLSGGRDSDERRNPNFDAGIIIKKHGKKIGQIKCVDDNLASIRSVAYEVLKEERYEDLELR